jgi:hypothetical protein
MGMTWDPAQGERHRERQTTKTSPKLDRDRASDNGGDGGLRSRGGDRRNGFRRAEDLERRLAELEELARANQRELHLQFQRMAHMQAELDSILRPATPLTSRPRLPYENKGLDREATRPVDARTAAVPPVPDRRRS